MGKSATEMRDQVAAYLRARCGVIWVVTTEERRTVRTLRAACEAAGYVPYLWDGFSGLSTADRGTTDPAAADPLRALATLNSQATRQAWIMHDLHRLMSPDGTVIRAVRTVAQAISTAPRDRARAIIITSPSREVPPELASLTTLIEWPVPDREEVSAILDALVNGQKPEVKEAISRAWGKHGRARTVDAALGLSGEAAEAAFAHAVIRSITAGEARIDPAEIAAEKRRIVRGKGVEWYDPNPAGLDAIGGLDVFKAYLGEMRAALTPEARAYGLPQPRGILLIGVPGTGKSEGAKCAPVALGNLPLLRFDAGALRSKWVGESEGNLRAALDTARAVAPCVMWIDEVEKAMAGAVQGGGDGGVTADLLGTLLSFMQDPNGVIVVATANDVTKLPPEMLRKGRFDEMFFFDLPDARERVSILAACLRRYGVDPASIDGEVVSQASAGCVGAEILSAVESGRRAAFMDGARPLTTDDVVRALNNTVRLSVTMREKVAALREWAKGRARPASAQLADPEPLAESAQDPFSFKKILGS